MAKKRERKCHFFNFFCQKVKNLFSDIFFKDTPLPSEKLITAFFYNKRRDVNLSPTHLI